MLKFNPIPPTNITLISTLLCTAECENCCFGCNPRQGKAMTLDEMKTYVDKCLKAWPDSIKRLDITGGECMTIREAVEGIVEYGTKKGLAVGILSNAFWATSMAKATRILKSLSDKGLKVVTFSTGENHTEFVPFKNVRTAAVAAARLGIDSYLRVEMHNGISPLKREIDADEELVRLVNGGEIKLSYDTWMAFVKKGRAYKTKYIQGKDYKSCPWIFNTVPINPYGEVFACCGLPAARLPYLRLGNINKEPIRTIYERAFSDVLKVWLKMKGPHNILKYVQEKTGWKFDWHANHICDMCRVIMSDPRIIPFLREHYYENINSLSIFNDVYAKHEETPFS